MRLLEHARRRLVTILLLGALLAVSAIAFYSQVELATTNAQLSAARQTLAVSQGALADTQSHLTTVKQQLSQAQQTPRIPSLTLPATSQFVILQGRLDDIDSRLFQICLKVGC